MSASLILVSATPTYSKFCRLRRGRKSLTGVPDKSIDKRLKHFSIGARSETPVSLRSRTLRLSFGQRPSSLSIFERETSRSTRDKKFDNALQSLITAPDRVTD